MAELDQIKAQIVETNLRLDAAYATNDRELILSLSRVLQGQQDFFLLLSTGGQYDQSWLNWLPPSWRSTETTCKGNRTTISSESFCNLQRRREFNTAPASVPMSEKCNSSCKKSLSSSHGSDTASDRESYPSDTSTSLEAHEPAEQLVDIIPKQHKWGIRFRGKSK